MGRAVLTSLVVLLVLAIGPVDAGDAANRDGGERPGWRCQPVLPILDVSVNADGTGNAIRSCEVINDSDQWTAYCAEHGLVCDAYDDSFFDDWTITAVMIETASTRICDNSGPVPAWRLGCLSLRGPVVLARVELTEAGAACSCTMNPQWPIRRHLVQAIPATEASDCRPWQENHVIACLPGL
jgi:hypothetical protein